MENAYEVAPIIGLLVMFTLISIYGFVDLLRGEYVERYKGERYIANDFARLVLATWVFVFAIILLGYATVFIVDLVLY